MMTFFLAMALHPDIMRKVQHEIDAVTGGDRLPTFDDHPRLPFVDAVCREVLRWQPVTPHLSVRTSVSQYVQVGYLDIAFTTAVPHATTKDDIYNGFLIPKGVYPLP